MKNIFIILFISSLAQGVWADQLNYTDPEEFASAPNGVYTPQGFDTNDNVEIIFEGQFSDACHKVGMTSHFVDEDSKSIYITDSGYYFGDSFCASVIVPYQKGINAGLLREGEYTVYFRHSRGNFVEQGVIPVKPAKTSRPDDHLYAPVEQTRFISGIKGRPNQLKLYGKFPNTCMRMDEVRVVQHPQSNVVDILPIAMMERGGCQEAPEGLPFEHTVDLSDLRAGRMLLHTRALNGQSVNEIVTVR